MSLEALEQCIASRLQSFFADQAAGLDIAPADLYRLEGLLEASLLLGLYSEDQIRDQLCALAKEHLSMEITEFYRQDYRLILHMHMREAPVYPSGHRN
ncbi:hypothetical protein HCU74_11095 [Spongiibacter sp. KMU-166]|uniref:Uncharacterized protein n=1 Tax=Spongiibacter thalassae TaxID=2721624 RepID=A0ABX1GHU4_9GAMM|nr:hypothetical protein [Spongiibacter thalassae]NKI17952.1 hypothetical protein [Spongiibacter thalassae]